MLSITPLNEVRERRLQRKNAFINKIILYFQTISVFVSFSMIYYQHFRHQPWSMSRIIGLFISLVGYVLWCLSRLEIGESFAFLPQQQRSVKLIKSGVYSLISHPIYIFSSISLFGYILFIARPKLLVIFVILIPLQWYRAKQEQAVLIKVHGKEYEDYLQNVIV